MTSFAAFLDLLSVAKEKLQKSSIVGFFFLMELYYAAVCYFSLHNVFWRSIHASKYKCLKKICVGED